MRSFLSFLSPVTHGDTVVLTPEQRAAVRALYMPSVLVLGGSAVLMLLVLLGYVNSTLSTFRSYGENVMFNSLCLGIVLCYATLPARRSELQWVVPLAVLGEAYRFIAHPLWWSVTMRLQTFGYIAGLITMTAIAWRTFRAEGDERLWSKAMLLLSLMMFFFPNVSYMLHMIVVNHTHTLLDAYAYRVDGAFGFQPAAEANILVGHSQLMWYLTFFTYNELPLFMIVAVLLSLRWPRACYGNLMFHIMTIGLVGFLCYYLVPMKGIDLFVGEGWPTVLPDIGTPEPYTDWTGATRNCYPSLHMGWMLAVWLGTRHVNPWIGRFWGFLVFIMAFATLNIGHYVVDLVASFPYVVAFFGLINANLSTNRTSRAAAVVICGGLFVGFTVMLLRAPVALATHPWPLLLMALSIIGISMGLEHWMARTTLVAPCDEPEEGRPVPHWEPAVVAEEAVLV